VTTLTRYLLRAHVGPFAFAFAAVTGLLFLTAVAQRFQELAGKGVGLAVILELMLLSLPHVVTLAVPMALFAATLYVFADLSQNSELTAMAAGGVHPARLLAPLLVAGITLSLLMVVFNDRILAGANARFQDRLEDVARTNPALRLRAGVMNTLRATDGSLRYVLVRSTAAHGNTLRGVTIADFSRPNRPRFVTADSGSVARQPNRRDILIRLAAGQFASPFMDRPGTLQLVEFQSYLVILRGLAAGVERGTRVGARDERELSIATLRGRIREAQDTARASASGDAREASAATARARRSVVIRSRAELHRRYATAFACAVFVLLAAPLGIRFAHGGIGAIIALSVAVLFFFRVGIIWGDRLSDAGRLDPIVGSWTTVGVLLLTALLFLRGLGGAVSNAQRAPEANRSPRGSHARRRTRVQGRRDGRGLGA
jgi:lipopolysaccharide export system permease protein